MTPNTTDSLSCHFLILLNVILEATSHLMQKEKDLIEQTVNNTPMTTEAIREQAKKKVCQALISVGIGSVVLLGAYLGRQRMVGVVVDLLRKVVLPH